MINIETIRNKFSTSIHDKYTLITNFEEADKIVKSTPYNDYRYILFRTTALKIYYINSIQSEFDVNIINCDSKIERFCYDISKEGSLKIFINVQNCNNHDILNIIRNEKGIIIC